MGGQDAEVRDKCCGFLVRSSFEMPRNGHEFRCILLVWIAQGKDGNGVGTGRDQAAAIGRVGRLTKRRDGIGCRAAAVSAVTIALVFFSLGAVFFGGAEASLPCFMPSCLQHYVPLSLCLIGGLRRMVALYRR